MRRVVGAAMVATPFVALFAAIVYNDGPWLAIKIFGSVATLVAWLAIAIHLTQRK